MGMECAKFMGADGELVGLKNVLWVLDLCANLISTDWLGDAGVNTETIGLERYRAYNGERLIWDLQRKGDVHKRMWQIPVLPWWKSGKVAAAASMEESVTEEEQNGVQGEELIGRSAAVKASATSGQATWETWHWWLAHMAVSTLEGSAKAPLEVVHMDLVGPMRTEGTGGVLYFLTMVDEWSRFTWARPLSKKSDAATSIKEDWLPMVEWQAMRLVKVLRSDRGGEFLGAEFTKFLKRNGIRHQLTCLSRMALLSQSQQVLIGLRLQKIERSAVEEVQLHLEDLRRSELTSDHSGGGEQQVSGPAGEEGLEDESARVDSPTQPEPAAKAKKRVAATPSRLKGGPKQGAMAVQADEGEDEEMAFYFFTPLPGEPATVEEALSGPQKEWKAAMDAEFNSLIENETWELVELPEGRQPISSNWVFKVKSGADGALERFKSRLVAKGFQQKEKVDFREIFASVAKPVTRRTLLAGAAVNGWYVKQMDITTAFLNGVLLEDIYMVQPNGYEVGTSRVCKLKKAIYGVKQTPRCYYENLEEVLHGGGFKTSQEDHRLLLLGEEEQLLLLLVYVDDILLFSPSIEQIERTQKLLMDNFKCKMLEDVHYYLGLQIERDVERRWLKVHQSHNISGVMERYGAIGGCIVMTSFLAGFKLKKAAV
ncbi:unnamed protein product [Closterium sp. NIES-53]